jgi:hypothetical protein
MRNAAIVLLAILVGALGTFVYHQETSLGEQRRLVQELTTRLEAGPKTSNLDLQEKCSLQARREFTQFGWDKQLGSYINHYNTKLNRCFIVLESHVGDLTTKVLSDAFEGDTYASYEWHSHPPKKYWEVPPSVCTVTIYSKQDPQDSSPWFCHSSDEFDELVSRFYMRE